MLRLWMTRGCRISVAAEDPTQLVNALCRGGITVAALRPGEGCFLLDTEDLCARQVLELAGQLGIPAKVEKRWGMGNFLRRFRPRPALLLIPFALVLLTLWFSTRIWEIQVEGNETLRVSEIRAALETAGVYPGVSGLTIDNAKVRSYMQSLLPELSWCTVQVHGSRAVVVVRERRMPPKVVDERQYGDLVAKKSGVLEFVSILEGKAEVRKGELVLEGQTLATGTLSDKQEETRYAHAMGAVWAQTWYEKTMEIPLNVCETWESGRTKRRYALKICDFRLNFYIDSGISMTNYAKIEVETRPTIGGLSLPFSIVRTELREYDTVQREWTAEEAEALLRQRLLSWLDARTEGAECLSAEFETEMAGDRLRVTLHAVCREQIAVERPYD